MHTSFFFFLNDLYKSDLFSVLRNSLALPGSLTISQNVACCDRIDIKYLIGDFSVVTYFLKLEGAHEFHRGRKIFLRRSV